MSLEIKDNRRRSQSVANSFAEVLSLRAAPPSGLRLNSGPFRTLELRTPDLPPGTSLTDGSSGACDVVAVDGGACIVRLVEVSDSWTNGMEGGWTQ